jgi:hypothetical protein
MTLGQQIASQVVTQLTTAFRLRYVYPRIRRVLEDNWSNASLPGDLAELEKTSAISFSNEDMRLFHYQEPRVADLVQVGGLHIMPAKPLSKVQAIVNFKRNQN